MCCVEQVRKQEKLGPGLPTSTHSRAPQTPAGGLHCSTPDSVPVDLLPVVALPLRRQSWGTEAGEQRLVNKAGSFSPLTFLAADSTSTQSHSPPLSAPISLPKAEKKGGHLQETCLSMQRKELTCGDAEKVTDSNTQTHLHCTLFI